MQSGAKPSSHRTAVQGQPSPAAAAPLHRTTETLLQRAQPPALSTCIWNSSYLHLLMLLLQGNHREGLIILISLIISALNCSTF